MGATELKTSVESGCGWAFPFTSVQRALNHDGRSPPLPPRLRSATGPRLPSSGGKTPRRTSNLTQTRRAAMVAGMSGHLRGVAQPSPALWRGGRGVRARPHRHGRAAATTICQNSHVVDRRSCRDRNNPCGCGRPGLASKTPRVQPRLEKRDGGTANGRPPHRSFVKKVGNLGLCFSDLLRRVRHRLLSDVYPTVSGGKKEAICHTAHRPRDGACNFRW